jgi:nitroreductase
MQIIRMPKDGAPPQPVENAAKLCIHCGHCLCSCPTGALSLSFMDVAKCTDLDDDRGIEQDQAERMFKSRRTIRKFKDQSVPRQTIDKLLEIASYAPSGKNAQPVRWIVLDGPTLKKAAGLVIDWMRLMCEKQPEIAQKESMPSIVLAWDFKKNIISYNAPHCLIAYGKASDRRAGPACTIALAHLELASRSFDLGACWVGYLNFCISVYPPLFEFLGLKEGQQAFGSLLLGYPDIQFHRIPLRNKPVVSWKNGDTDD